MTPTIEQIKEILTGAPDGATHYAIVVNEYIKQSEKGVMVWDDGEWDYEIVSYLGVHSLSDLRTILAQHEEIERNKQRITELEAQLPKWISVCEHLPKDGVVVLVNAVGYEVFTAYLDHGSWEYIEDHIGTAPQEFTHGCFYDSDVTHWMPLPQPPKEQDDE